MKRLTALLMIGILAGCSDEGEVVVYEAGPHVAQCAAAVITPAQSAGKLTAAGITVHRSSCGHIEGVAYPAVCGAGTGEILLHDIPAASLAQAEAAGFELADRIAEQGPGTGWRRSVCAYYVPAIEVAQQTPSCTDLRNRVFVIEEAARPHGHMMLLDQAGNCADASYRQVLYGATVDDVQCSNMDSFGGPQKSCPVAARAAVFDMILASLGAADLGLGSGYRVRQVFSGN